MNLSPCVPRLSWAQRGPLSHLQSLRLFRHTPNSILVSFDFPKHNEVVCRICLRPPAVSGAWASARLLRCRCAISTTQTRRTAGIRYALSLLSAYHILIRYWDFLFMIAYAVGMNALVLFSCKQKRLYSFIGALVQVQVCPDMLRSRYRRGCNTEWYEAQLGLIKRSRDRS
jgi:hypothetical protein